MSKSKLPDNAELRRLHIDENIDVSKIADMFGASRTTVHHRILQAGITRPKRTASRADLEKLYIDQKLTLREVAEALGFSRSFIRTELIRYNIERRSRKKIGNDRDLLYKMYVADGMFMREIAEKLGCTSQTVAKAIRKNGISERHSSTGPPLLTAEQLQLMYVVEERTTMEIARLTGCHDNNVRFWLRKYGIPMEVGRGIKCNEEVLRKLYIDEQMSVREIAKRLDVSASGVYFGLRRHGIAIHS